MSYDSLYRPQADPECGHRYQSGFLAGFLNGKRYGSKSCEKPLEPQPTAPPSLESQHLQPQTSGSGYLWLTFLLVIGLLLALLYLVRKVHAMGENLEKKEAAVRQIIDKLPQEWQHEAWQEYLFTSNQPSKQQAYYDRDSTRQQQHMDQQGAYCCDGPAMQSPRIPSQDPHGQRQYGPGRRDDFYYYEDDYLNPPQWKEQRERVLAFGPSSFVETEVACSVLARGLNYPYVRCAGGAAGIKAGEPHDLVTPLQRHFL